MRWAAAVRVLSSAFGHRWLYTFNVIDAEEWPKACCTVTTSQPSAIKPVAK